MSVPSLIAPGAPSQFSRAHRNALGESANDRDFLALMDSLVEKDPRTRKADGVEAPSSAASSPTVSSFPTLNSSLKHDPGMPAEASPAVYDSCARALVASANPGTAWKSGAETDLTNGLGPELKSLLSVNTQPAGALLDAEQRRGVRATSALPDISSTDHEDSISRAFSSAANEMQLRVARATSHFNSGPVAPGQATSQPKAMVTPPVTEGCEETAIANPASSKEPAASPPSVDAQLSLAATADSSNATGGSTILTLSDVSLPLVPQALSEAVETLQAAQAPPTSMSSSSAEAVTHASGAITRELEIHLAPSGLGSLFVKMKLSGGALSVVIEASKPSTLSAVEAARDTIIERLAAANQLTASLILKPTPVSQTRSEDANASSESGATQDGPRGQSYAGQQSPDRRGSRDEYRGPDQNALNGARHFVL